MMSAFKHADERHCYVEYAFPFTLIQGISQCPPWIKSLLFEKYSLSHIVEVISYFNEKKELFDPFRDSLLSQDIDIEPYSDFEVAVLLKVENPVVVRVISDEGDSWEIRVDEEKHTVLELKRLILNKKNRPFMLNIPAENNTLISAFLDKNMAQKGIQESDFKGKLVDRKSIFA